VPVSRSTGSRLRRGWTLGATLAVSAAVTLTPPIGAPARAAGLDGRIQRSRSRDRRLQAGIAADRRHAAAYQGRIDDLRAQLSRLSPGLEQERAELDRLQGELRVDRAALVRLRAQDARDREVLADQLVAIYEAPPVDLVQIALDSRGFADLLSRFGQLRRIAERNATVTRRVAAEHRAVAATTARIGRVEARHAATTAALQARHDAVQRLELELVDEQLPYVRARRGKERRLTALRRRRAGLVHELERIQARQLRAISGGTPVGGADGYGFFPAAGTSYAQGDEPQIAARLQRMGRALHLHLIGLSGYRSPQHSVEVGGFANDPHTRGEASDTPGLEGVPEATLNRFGLTRPFPGAREADHVQLVGSRR
jgi:hypothetical protein